MWIKKFRDLFLDLLFPKSCLNCGKSGFYLCFDCLALIEISNKVLLHAPFLSSLYFATNYQNFLVKQLMQKFKYSPFAKELAKDLSLIIITYLENLEKQPQFLKSPQEYLLIPVPLHSKKLRYRGFNQAGEIGRIIAGYYSIPFFEHGLEKTCPTLAQADLPKEKRKNNLKNAFACPQPKIIANKKIILFDDIVTTETTMKECARALSRAGASQIIGLCLAHA